MSERQPTRAELLERIEASSKDAVVLAEMQRLGFWPADSGPPGIEATLIEREAELAQALNQLQAELHEKGDPQRALKAMRQERMARARERREATAQARERRRHERALRWHQARQQQAGYLGAGVSGGLQPQGLDDAAREKLRRHGLPELQTPQALAEAMGISLAELKFLSFHREVARTTHYRRFALPKKTGGERIISAPMPRLKRAQYWVLDQLLAKVPCHEAAHGFLAGRNIVSNAAPHCGQAVVINLDLKDFFPSIGYPRIKGVFAGLGYGEDVASVLALLCSENACDELQVDGERFYVGGKGRDRVLPQGAPTSPMLTNILCRKLDRRLAGLARKLGFAYTRYADDLTFSASGEAAQSVGRLLRQVHHVLEDEGFVPHPDKQRVMRAGSRQEVTGVVVNQQPAASREQRRALRAALHRARTGGLDSARWQGEPATRERLLGYAQFVQMVNPRQGATLLAQARALPTAARPAARAPAVFRQHAARGEAPPRASGAAWWQPAPRPEPVLQLTAGQIKARRDERLARQRAERDGRPVEAPAAPVAGRGAIDLRKPADSAVATPPAAPQDKLPPISWWRYLLQVGLLVKLAVTLKSPLLFMLGAVWLGVSLVQRRLGWPRYLLGLALSAAVAYAVGM